MCKNYPRELLMVTSFKDLRDSGEVWGRAKLDLGDADISFPVSSGVFLTTMCHF